MPWISKLFRKAQAASTRSGVSRLITPMVRWIAPTGRMAFAGNLAASPASLGVVTSAVKRWREDCSCGRDVGVTRGRRRKCVSWGFGLGGMVGGGGPWVWVYVLKGEEIHEGDVIMRLVSGRGEFGDFDIAKPEISNENSKEYIRHPKLIGGQ